MAWTETHIFREVLPPLPKGWKLGHWQVEAHRETEFDSYCCPVGIAWVNRVGVHNGMPTIIEFVQVLPQFQRQGVARRLVEKCLERWPDAELTEAISPTGQRLYDAIYRARADKESHNEPAQ